MPLQESLLVMQVMNKVRKGGGLRYLEALEDVEDEGPYYALASPRESEAIWPYPMSTRDFISNTDRLFQRMDAT